MATIDRADWHYGGEFPEQLPAENGGNHIGMYLSWIINNDLIGKLHLEESKEGLQEVKNRSITGRDFLFDHCDGKFWDEDLNEEGLEFTRHYYQNPKDPNGGYGQYLEDYEIELGSPYDSLYEIPNTWENYDLISKRIDEEYIKWKNHKTKRRWKFWSKK